MHLTDEHRTVLELLIGEMPRRADGRGRSWRSSREVLTGTLWLLRTGAQWANLPEGIRRTRPAMGKTKLAACVTELMMPWG